MNASYIISGGAVLGVAGGPLSLAGLPRETRRLSRVEFNGDTNRWEVRRASDNELLHAELNYDDALAWETAYFNRMIETSVSVPHFEIQSS